MDTEKLAVVVRSLLGEHGFEPEDFKLVLVPTYGFVRVVCPSYGMAADISGTLSIYTSIFAGSAQRAGRLSYLSVKFAAQ